MREPIILLPLALLSCNVLAPPALAGQSGVGQHSAAQIVAPFFPATNGLASLGQLPPVTKPLGGAPGDRLPGGVYYAGQPRSAPMRVVVAQQPAPSLERKLSVETTPDGVQIVRGPGSRHIMP